MREIMNRTDAVRLVGKLREVRVDRGATAAEAASAAAKAERLVRRFDLNRRESHPPPPRAPRRQRVYHAPPQGPADWEFNAKTGEHSENVKVHRWNGLGDWHIEIPIDHGWPLS